MKPSISIEGGYLVPETDKVATIRCQETGRLDFDFELLEKVREFIPSGGVVMDVGACIGCHSLFYSNIVGPEGTVIALEPGDENMEFLNFNAMKFPIQNVFTTNLAVGHRQGHGRFKYHPDNVGESTCEMVRSNSDVTNHDFYFDCIDNILNNVSPRKVDFIKIDVEGWELYALVGAMMTLKRDRPVLLVEINPGAMKRMNISFGTLTSYLVDMGYRMKRLQDIEIGPTSVYDFICQPIS